MRQPLICIGQPPGDGSHKDCRCGFYISIGLAISERQMSAEIANTATLIQNTLMTSGRDKSRLSISPPDPNWSRNLASTSPIQPKALQTPASATTASCYTGSAAFDTGHEFPSEGMGDRPSERALEISRPARKNARCCEVGKWRAGVFVVCEGRDKSMVKF